MVKLDIRPIHGRIGDTMEIMVIENGTPVQRLEISIGTRPGNAGETQHHIVVSNIGVPVVPMLQLVK
jgi:hypothetical protein